MAAVTRALLRSLQFDKRAGANDDGLIEHVSNCKPAGTIRRALASDEVVSAERSPADTVAGPSPKECGCGWVSATKSSFRAKQKLALVLEIAWGRLAAGSASSRDRSERLSAGAAPEQAL